MGIWRVPVQYTPVGNVALLHFHGDISDSADDSFVLLKGICSPRVDKWSIFKILHVDQ